MKTLDQPTNLSIHKSMNIEKGGKIPESASRLLLKLASGLAFSVSLNWFEIHIYLFTQKSIAQLKLSSRHGT